VIPAYNEERTIGSVIERARKHGEVVVVNDGSTDGTRSIAENAGVKVISNTRNMGYSAAVRLGIKSAKRDVVALLDADLQQVPEELPLLLLPILENKADLVIGSKFMGRLEYRPNLPNYLMDKTVCAVLRLRYGLRLTNSYSGFRAMRRSCIDFGYLKGTKHTGMLELDFMFSQKHYRIMEIPRTARRRVTGRSSIHIKDGLFIFARMLQLMMLVNVTE
jgi:glycosyltransferase involved in cell wall biosynthesis